MGDTAINGFEPAGGAMPPVLTGRLSRPSSRMLWKVGIGAGGLLILGVLVWQAVTAAGNPDPEAAGISRWSVILDTGILVFREGLEAILVLAALTASLVRTEEGYWKPVALGAGLSFLASIATWFVVVAIISRIENDVPALYVQAATGLLAILVLLVIMNWFFHKIYWTGWITHHNKRKKDLMESPDRGQRAIFRGLVLVGFTCVYREGFEVVLFLQTMRLKAGSSVVLDGVMIGLGLTLIVAMLTFVAHYRLPYKKMLVLTGIMLGAVLLVMVGEQAQEMQQAGWLSTTTLPFSMPGWMDLWFSVYPTLESLSLQVLAAAFVIGSYFLAQRVCNHRHRAVGADAAVGAQCIVPDCDRCETLHPHEPAAQSVPTQIRVVRK